LFCLITSLYWFSLYTYVPTLPLYAKALGASYKIVGLIIGSYGFVQMLLRIPLGVVSDRLGKRKVFVTAGLCLTCASGIGLFLSKSPLTLLASRSLAGAAASTWVAYTVLFSSYFQQCEAPRAIGIINAYNNIGQTSAMLLGGFVADRFGPTAPFLLAIAGGAIGILASLAVVENEPAGRPASARALLALGRERNLLIVSGLGIIVQFLAFGTIYGFTPIAAKAIGATSFQLGILTSVTTLPVILASALSGSFFSKAVGERRAVSLGFLAIAASCVVVPYVKTIPVLYLTQLIGGFGRGLAFPLLMGLSIKTVPIEKRATAMGFFQAIYSLGMFLGPVVVGFLGDTVGLAAGFWTVGAVGMVGAILAETLIGRASEGAPHAI
jgi:MFS family permease